MNRIALSVALAAALWAVPRPAAAADCQSAPYDCAAAHIQRQEIAAAIRVLEPLVKQQPRNLKALNLLGIALTAAGRIDAADARFRDVLRIDPAFYPSLKNLAINAFNRKQLTDGQRHFEAVLKLVPGDEVAHVHLGEIKFARQDCPGAVPHYETSGVRVRLNPAWVIHYATCLLTGHQHARAIALLDELPAADGAARFEAGVAPGRAGAHAEAARFFASARKTLAGDRRYEAGYNQILMLVNAGDAESAVRAGEDMIAAGTVNGELHSLMSRAFLKLGRIKDAYDALRTAARLEPEVEVHYVDLAMMCLDLENHDLGLEIVDVGLHYRPESFMLYLQRRVLLAMKAQLGQAEQEFENARRLAPDQPAPYAALAMIWMQTGQTEKAVARLREEARKGSNNHIIPYTFAVALVRSGIDPAAPAAPEASEAIEALRASIKVNPEFAPARSQLGRLLLRQGQIDAAIDELEKAVTLDPGATAALYNLGQAYNKKGDRRRASELLGRVSKLNAEERGDDPESELKRTVIRIVKEVSAAKPGTAP